MYLVVVVVAVSVVVVVVVVEQTMYSIYNIIVGRGCLGVRVSSRRGAHFCSFWSSRLGKVIRSQSQRLGNNYAQTRNIHQKWNFDLTKVT